MRGFGNASIGFRGFATGNASAARVGSTGGEGEGFDEVWGFVGLDVR